MATANQVAGFRERIKKAASLEEARSLLNSAQLVVSEKAYLRCVRAFEQLPFTKPAEGERQ